MEKYNNFSLSGFKDTQIANQLIQKLLDLGCKHIQKLSESTSILIVGATWTQKFKIAKLHKNPITCVTKKWVEDSFKKKTLLPPDKYLITQKQLFLGTHIALCGFPPEKQQKLQKIITDRQGVVFTKYKATELIRKYSQFDEIIDVVLASNDQVQRAKHAKLPDQKGKLVIPPLVRLQWLQDSIKCKRCKFPEDYAVNLILRKQINYYKSRLQTKLNNFLSIDLMDRSGDFMENTLIYIDKELSMDMTILLKNLISVCGGYWTDVFSSVVTHVLILETDQTKDQYYKKYGSRIYILRPQWLVDSMIFYNRLPEEDYLIRFYRPTEQFLRSLIQEQNVRNNQNSQNLNSLPQEFGLKFGLNTNTLPNLEMQRKKSRNQIKLSIFEGRTFFIPELVIQDKEYGEIKKLITNAGGLLYSKINHKMQVFVVLKDSPINKQIVQKLTKERYRYRVLSERWLRDCIKKNEFIRPDRTFLHYQAFNFNTPIPDFHKFIFGVIGLPDSSNTLRIKELFQTLGSKKTNPNRSQMTHVLCGPEWDQQFEVIKKISKQNNKFQLVKLEWLFACVKQGKIVNLYEYFISNPADRQNICKIQCKIQQSFESNSDKNTNQTDRIINEK